jgi:hypothetical protein
MHAPALLRPRHGNPRDCGVVAEVNVDSSDARVVVLALFVARHRPTWFQLKQKKDSIGDGALILRRSEGAALW